MQGNESDVYAKSKPWFRCICQILLSKQGKNSETIKIIKLYDLEHMVQHHSHFNNDLSF